ncbi:MAG: hypothetical protein WCK05_02540, partial [Planctomycetota bacterium]
MPPLPPKAIEAAKAADSSPSDDEAIDRSIGKAQRFLFAAQNQDSSWGSGTPGACDTTAIVAAALIRSGVKPFDKRIKPAITWLEKNKPAEASPGLRNLLALELCRRFQGPSLFDRRLLSNIRDGAYEKMAADPPPGEQVWTVLGLEAAEQARREIPPEFWKDVAAYWLRRLSPDGRCLRGGDSAWVLSNTATAIMAVRLCAERTDPGPFLPVGKNAAQGKELPPLTFLDTAFRGWPGNADNAGRDVPTNAY